MVPAGSEQPRKMPPTPGRIGFSASTASTKLVTAPTTGHDGTAAHNASSTRPPRTGLKAAIGAGASYRAKTGGFNCHGVDSRHLRPQVFLTVNVVGHVTWLGKEQVRNLVMNWIHPEDKGPDDWVGLFDRDVSKRVVLHPDEAKLAVVLNKTAGGTFFKTDVRFEYAQEYKQETVVQAVNCLKTSPRWMTKLRRYIGWLPINRLLIPGTHESLLVSQFRGYFANAVVRRWTYHQEESIWNQLVNLLSSMEGVTELLTKFAAAPNKSVGRPDLKGALGNLVRDLLRFAEVSRDMVVVYLRFKRKRRREAYDMMGKFLTVHLGKHLVPYNDKLGASVTLDRCCFSTNRSLVLAFKDVGRKGKVLYAAPRRKGSKRPKDSKSSPVNATADLFFWPPFEVRWNRSCRSPKSLEASLGKEFANRTSYSYLRAVVAALGHRKLEMAADAVDYRANGIRDRADKIDRDLDVWFRDRWWDAANLVATDYFLSNDLVDVAKEVNVKRAVCTAAGEGYHLARGRDGPASAEGGKADNSDAGGGSTEERNKEVLVGDKDRLDKERESEFLHRQAGKEIRANLLKMGDDE